MDYKAMYEIYKAGIARLIVQLDTVSNLSNVNPCAVLRELKDISKSASPVSLEKNHILTLLVEIETLTADHGVHGRISAIKQLIKRLKCKEEEL